MGHSEIVRLLISHHHLDVNKGMPVRGTAAKLHLTCCFVMELITGGFDVDTRALRWIYTDLHRGIQRSDGGRKAAAYASQPGYDGSEGQAWKDALGCGAAQGELGHRKTTDAERSVSSGLEGLHQ
eukprot:289621-Prorocentrum_minimum.AAC.1